MKKIQVKIFNWIFGSHQRLFEYYIYLIRHVKVYLQSEIIEY